MTVKELQSWLLYVRKMTPEAKNFEIVVEPKKVWSSYHMSPGMSQRVQHGKPNQIVWRMDD